MTVLAVLMLAQLVESATDSDCKYDDEVKKVICCSSEESCERARVQASTRLDTREGDNVQNLIRWGMFIAVGMCVPVIFIFAFMVVKQYLIQRKLEQLGVHRTIVAAEKKKAKQHRDRLRKK